MKLALIPPISLLTTTEQTKYQLMLPQLIDSSRYSVKYREHCKDPSTFVILDNGAAEGVDTPIDTLLNLATKFRVNEVVIPDAMGDAHATVTKAEQFYEDAVPARSLRQFPFTLMFVVQGTTLAEVLETGRWAQGQWWIDTLGIPRHMLNTLGDTKVRSTIANILSESDNPKQIHFLGGNPISPMEIVSLASPWMTEQKYLRGMDTSMPFTYAYGGQRLDQQKRYQVGPSRPDDYFNQKASMFDLNVMQVNIDALMKHTEVL